MTTAGIRAAALALLAATPLLAQEEDVLGRLEWERGKVAFPGDSIPADARLRMLEQVERFERFQRQRTPLALTPLNWEPLGPQPIAEGTSVSGKRGDVSGRVSAIAVNPRNASHWVIGAAGGGIWQSSNAGGTWVSNPADAETMIMGAVAFSADGATIYGGTGDGTVLSEPFRGLGVLRSTNTGKDWTLVGRKDLAGCGFSTIRVHPGDARKLVAAVAGRCREVGLIASNDGGESWTQEMAGAGTDVDADFRNGDLSRLYGGLYAQGVFRKREGSNAWVRVKDPWGPGDKPGRIMVAVAPGTLERVYVGVHDRVSDTNDLLGLWYTDNAWELDPTKIVWVKIDSSETDSAFHKVRGYCREFCWYAHRLLADPTDQDTLYAGGISLWRCDKCTSTAPRWTDLGEVEDSIHVDQHALAITGAASPSSSQGTFQKYRHTTIWCGDTNEGGGFSFTEPTANPLPLTFSGLTPCDTFKQGALTVSGTLTVPATPSGRLDALGGRFVLDTPMTVTLDLNASWATPANCFRAGACSAAKLFASVVGTRTQSVVCEKVESQASFQSGQTVSLHLTLSCQVTELQQHTDGVPEYSTTFLYGFRFLSGVGDTFPLSVRTSSVHTIGPPPPPRLIAGNDGGLYSAANPKDVKGWTNHNRTLAITQFNDGAANPTLETRGIGGAQDNGVDLWTGNDEWRLVETGDGGDIAIATAQNSHWGAAVDGVGRIVRTIDNGTTVEPVTSGLDLRKLPFQIPLVKCPNSDDYFLTGTDALMPDGTTYADALVMRNRDFFQPSPRWTQNIPDIIDFPAAITALAFAPSTGDCSTYAAASITPAEVAPTIAVTEDNGTSWRRIGNAPNLPNRYVADLKFSLTNPNVLWAAFLGIDDNTPPSRRGHLFRTDAALGQSGTPQWVDKTPRDPTTGNPIDMGIHSIFLDPKNRGTIFIGTDIAVWRSTDDGDHWTFMGPETGMPNVPVRDIQSSPTGVILAFTYGRGAFRYKQAKADVGIAKTGPPQVSVGETFSYLITVTNFGPDTATNVTVTDTLPPEMTFVAARPGQGTCRGTTTIECDLGTITAGSPPVGITIDVTATKVGTYFNKAKVISAAVDSKPLDNDAVAKTEVVDDSADLAITKTHSPDPVNVKEQLTYMLAVTNNGPKDATDVVVTDTLPPDVEFVSAAAAPGTCTGTATVTCTIGALAKGARASIVITVRTTQPGTLTNTARVTGKPRDPVPGNNTATDNVTVAASDLEVEKTVTPNPAKVGDRVTFHITVKNNGPDRATGVTVTDYLFPDLTLVSATSTLGSCAGAPTVVCSIGALQKFTEASITIVVTPTKAGRFCNAADVTGEQHDPNTGNNSSTACLDVEAPGNARCDRAVTKTHTPEPVLLGGRVTFTIVVKNNGPELSTGTTLTDFLPLTLTNAVFTPSQGSCSGDRVVSCFLGNIAAGGTATVVMTAKAVLDGEYGNRVSVAGNETDPNGGNDQVIDLFHVLVFPTIERLTPSSAKQGTRNIDLKIEGANYTPQTVVSFEPAAGIEVVAPPGPGFGFVSTAELHRIIHISDAAAIGEREVHVTNPGGLSGGLRPFNVFTVTPGQVPVIQLSPDSIAFGTTPAKVPVERTLAIQNTGTGVLTVKAMGINGGPMEIVSPAAPFNVGAGSSQNVRLRYNPQAAGSSTRMLVISSNDPARPSVTVSLSGTATEPLAPNVDLQPAALNFGTVPVGQTRTLGVTVRNTGNANLVLSSAASGDARFAASLALPLTLTPGAQQTFNVTFTPNAAGVVNAQLTFASNDPGEPSTPFQLRGEGASAGASETLAIDDGTLERGAFSDGLTIVNRLTPTRYPAKLTRISVFFFPFRDFPSPSGAQIRLIAYADSSGSAQGTQHPLILLSQTVTIPAVPAGGAFFDYDVAAGPTVSSGDLYVGFTAPNPTGGVIFPADTNGPQRERGYYSTDGGGTFVGPLTIGTTSGSMPANIMIRATTVSGAAASPCTWGIAPAKLDIPKEGGSGSIDVSAPAGCAWNVTSSSGFLTFGAAPGSAAEIALNSLAAPAAPQGSPPPSLRRPAKSPATRSSEALVGGTGSGRVSFTAAPYSGDTSRSATVTIADLNSSVGQSAAAPGSPGITSSVFVPIVLSTAGLNNSFFTSELTLTNRGSTSAVFQAAYTAALGGGGGTAFDVLPPGAQRVYPDGLAYLKSIGTPIPDSGNRGGTVTLSFSNLSSTSAGSATVRTSSNVPEGRAGLAYSGVPAAQALNATVYLLGLRQNATDRSNLALMNAAMQGDVLLRVTVYSGDPAAPISATLQDIALPPGGFNQISGVLGSNGLALTNGYVRVQKVGGTAPFYAYAVINDQANSDGSFVPPVLESALAGKPGLTLPVIVETSAFLSELIATNFGTARKTVRFSLIADGITAPNGTASFTLDLAAGQQLILPNLLQYLRDRGTPGIPAAGTTTVGPLFATVDGGEASGIFVGARTSSAGGGGRYGLFYTAVPTGGGATRSAWLFGLLQDASNRSNVAFVNTGEVDGSTDVFRLEIYDGETGTLVKTVDGVTLAARRWTQITTVLALHAPGVTNGYLKVTRTSGNNPFLTYAVVNDGGQPGQRSGDGAFVAMSSVDEELP